MQIQLLIPGLLWPAATLGSPTAGLRLDGLAALIGRGQWQLAAPSSYPHALLRLLGAATPSPEQDLPLARWRRLGEDELTDPGNADAHWLCADPVHLAFNREHLLLQGFEQHEIGLDEAHSLAATLNETFADLGEFVIATPNRWYLRLHQPADASFHALDEVIGRPIRHFLPGGEQARRWQRTLNELQIVLHNHAVNPQREAAGQRSINSLWLWGAGTNLNVSIPTPTDGKLLQASDPLTRGLLRSVAASISPPDYAQAASSPASLVMLDSVLAPARNLDLQGWTQALHQLEQQWFAPLAAAFKAGSLQRLDLIAPGDRATLVLSLQRSARWKFWRQPRAFDDLLRAAAPAQDLSQFPAPAPHSPDSSSHAPY